MELSISFLHNHSIESANAVKYHDVSDETNNKFIELFEAAHSASSAYQEYKNDLMKKHGEQYVTVSANRAIMPDYKWVFNFHSQYTKTKYGSSNGPDVFRLVKKNVDNFNNERGEELAKAKQTDSGETIVVLCDTFSKRVHENIPAAGDLLIMEQPQI